MENCLALLWCSADHPLGGAARANISYYLQKNFLAYSAPMHQDCERKPL